MGFSLKKLGNVAGKALGAATGSFFGGPLGAAAGFSGADAVLGAVGLGDDQLAAQENWNWQKKAADYKYAQDMNMWNLVNAYNDPVAQMERLQKAGLNPNLVYGGGNVTGNTSGSGPEYANIDASYTDRSVQRKQLALALEEHQQRITNQAIQNDLARQELVLRIKASEREDEKLNLLKSRAINLTNPTDWDNYWDDVEKNTYQRLRNEKLRQEVEENKYGLASRAKRIGEGVVRKAIGKFFSY